MFATTHVLASVVISQYSPNAWIAFFISLFSHYLLDLIPHGDRLVERWIKSGNYFKKSVIIFLSDIALIAIFFITFYHQISLPSLKILVAAIIGGLLPDVLRVTQDLNERYLYKITVFHQVFTMTRLDKILAYHKRMHDYIDYVFNKTITPNGIGVVIQALFLGIFLILALYPG
ncbi:MAG: hypothetical protein WCV50_04880 [Patescibacteria group bacterium]|jgi:hypothetical protein